MDRGQLHLASVGLHLIPDRPVEGNLHRSVEVAERSRRGRAVVLVETSVGRAPSGNLGANIAFGRRRLRRHRAKDPAIV